MGPNKFEKKKAKYKVTVSTRQLEGVSTGRKLKVKLV